MRSGLGARTRIPTPLVTSDGVTNFNEIDGWANRCHPLWSSISRQAEYHKMDELQRLQWLCSILLVVSEDYLDKLIDGVWKGYAKL
jgi:hypothetical protein